MFSMLGGNIDNFVSLGYFSRYNASLLPYFMYLMDALRKIMYNTFFDFSFDFTMGFSLLKRAPTFFVMFILMLPYSQAREPHAMVFDELLHTLMAFDLMSRVLKL